MFFNKIRTKNLEFCCWTLSWWSHLHLWKFSFNIWQ